MKKTMLIVSLVILIVTAIFVGCGRAEDGKVGDKSTTNMPTSSTTNSMAGEAATKVGDKVGEAAKGAGDAAGEVATDAGNMVKDAVTGAGDVVSNVVS